MMTRVVLAVLAVLAAGPGWAGDFDLDRAKESLSHGPGVYGARLTTWEVSDVGATAQTKMSVYTLSPRKFSKVTRFQASYDEEAMLAYVLESTLGCAALGAAAGPRRFSDRDLKVVTALIGLALRERGKQFQQVFPGYLVAVTAAAESGNMLCEVTPL